jgi:hypothetical protein
VERPRAAVSAGQSSLDRGAGEIAAEVEVEGEDGFDEVEVEAIPAIAANPPAPAPAPFPDFFLNPPFA